MMAEHQHACLACRPEMVPDFDRADPRYHHFKKCRIDQRYSQSHVVHLDGEVIPLTSGHFEGAEGWALVPGPTPDEVHACGCGAGNTCVEPRFGVVTSAHVAKPA